MQSYSPVELAMSYQQISLTLKSYKPNTSYQESLISQRSAKGYERSTVISVLSFHREFSQGGWNRNLRNFTNN